MNQSLVATSLFIVTIPMLLAYTRRTALLSAARINAVRSVSTVVGSTPSATKPTVAETSPPKIIPPTTSASAPVDASACDVCACDEKPNDMLGSVKPYDRHVVICVPPNSDAAWERDIEDHAANFPYNLNTHIETLMKANKPPKAPKGTENTAPVVIAPPVSDEAPKKSLKVRVTAMVLSPSDPNPSGSAQILVYPDNLSFSLLPEQVASFAEFVAQPVPLRESTALENYAYSEPSFKKLVLVCVHGSRDKRCGRAGPQVITELERLLEQKNLADTASTTVISTSSNSVQPHEVAVRGSSHIGGHVYAGTMIVYPEGQWYGRITKHNSAELLSNILNGTVYSKCSRGNTRSNVLKW